MEKAGIPTRYNTARKALDDAMARSCNLQELKAIRHELKLAADIEARSPHIEEQLQNIDKERQKEMQM